MYDDADDGDAYGDYPYKRLLFELKSIDQALYNTGLLLPKAKYSLGIFINLVLWQHIVVDDDDGNDDVEDGDGDDVEGHQREKDGWSRPSPSFRRSNHH